MKNKRWKQEITIYSFVLFMLGIMIMIMLYPKKNSFGVRTQKTCRKTSAYNRKFA